jgi:hypothetical protein
MFPSSYHLPPIQLQSKHLPAAFVTQGQTIVFSQAPGIPIRNDPISLLIVHNQRLRLMVDLVVAV